MSIQDYAIAGAKIGVHNHYQLKVSELEKQRPDVMLSVLKFSGQEAISQPWKYTIEVTSPTADIPAEFLINTSALFLFYPDGQPWQTVKPRVLRGVVTAFQQCGSSADETRYVVTLEPRLALLNNSLTYAVYQHKSVIGTAEDILKRHQFSSLDYRYQLNTQYPPRDFYISWDESDLTFIQRHLARVGVFYYFAYDEENRRDVMVLGDSSYAWVTGPAIPFRHPAGLFDGGLESVWDMSVKRQSIPKQVRMNDEYYRDAQADMEALTARYFTDYSSAWLNFLNSLQWEQAASLSDAIDQFTLMADVRQSPLIALMNTLAYQGKAGQTGEGLSDSLVKSAQDLLHTRKKPVIDQQAGAHGPLDDTFGPLLSLMEGTAGGQGNNNLSLQTFLTRITRVRLKLQQVTNAPDPQAMMQSLALAVFQGKAVDLTDTRDYGSLIAASLGQEWSGFGQAMFVQPMVQAWQQVLTPTAESINTQWQTEIVSGWNKAFNDRYPFVDRKSEASLPQLAQFLRTDTGNIVQFIQTRLGGILRKEGDNWVPDAMNSQGLTFNPEFLAALNQLTRIANVAFNHGDVELHFELMGKPSRDVVESELVVDRQTLKYFNQMESWQTMTWPDNRWQPQTLLSWTSVKTGARIYGDFPGSWGFIRLLDKALVTELGDNTYKVAWKAPDGLVINYMLRTELGKGPLALLDLRGFSLPTQIFDAVDAGDFEQNKE